MVYMVQCPLDRVCIGHERRSCSDAVETRTMNIEISGLVVGNGGKIVIVKDGVNSRPVQI